MSCSEQLRLHGVSVSDSNFRESCKTIFSMFADKASANYEVVEQGIYALDDSRRWCDLCGNADVITYYRVNNVSGAPVQTVHTGDNYPFDFVLTWPNSLKLGTSCVKILNVRTYNSKMFDSMLVGHHPFELTPNGLILTGRYLLAQHKHWTNNVLIIPHALFTLLPEFAYTQTSAEIYSVNNPINISGCTEKALRRSFLAYSQSKAKYGLYQRMTDIVVRTNFCGTDKAFPSLVTIMSQHDAIKVLEIFKSRRKQ